MNFQGMKVNKTFTRDLKLIESGHPYHTVQCVFNDMIDRFMVIVTDKRTKKTRILKVIEHDNGAFKQPDQRDVLHLINNVEWNMLDKYPDPTEMWTEIFKEKDYRKMKKKEQRAEWRRWFNKEHRKQWREVIEGIKSDFRQSPHIFA